MLIAIARKNKARKEASMLGQLIEQGIRKFETKYSYDGSYLRSLARTSTVLLFKFNQFVSLSRYRKQTPPEVYYVAKIAALKFADCGPCLQLTVDFALEENLSSTVLEAAVKKPESLSGDLKLAYDFGFAVASNREDYPAISEQFERTFGNKALVETSVAVATAIVYPTLKRGLRQAQACHLVQVKVR